MRLLPIQEGPEAKWNLIFPRGEWFGQNLAPIGGSIKLDDALFAELMTNWQNAGRPPLPVTYHHVDSEHAPGVTPEEKKKAAGWFEDLRVTPYGLEGLTKWTEAAKERIRADEYRFFSPEWTSQHIDRRTGETKGWWLYGAALLNDPFFNELPRVAAKDIEITTHQTTKGTAPKEPQMDKKRLCAALGMPETAPDEEVMAALEAKCKAKQPDDGAKLSAAMKEVAEPLKAALSATEAKVALLEAANAKLVTERLDVEVKLLADEVVAAGKVLPVDREKVVAFAKKYSVEDARTVYGGMARVVPATGELGIKGDDTAPTALATLKAQYEAEMDASAKAGESVLLATRRIANKPEFRPLLAANRKSLSTNSREEA
jgi:phage I-like protein